MAAHALTRHGYTVSRPGGLNVWAAAGLPVITNGDKRGQII